MGILNDDISDFFTGSPGCFELGDILGGAYEIIEFLGSGAHSEVYKVKNLSDNHIYVAKVPSDSNSCKQFEHELDIFKRLRKLPSCDNLVQVHPAIHHEGQPILILEYLDGPTLSEYIKEQPQPLSEETRRCIISDILTAASILHKAKIVHRDIKPDNIKLLPRGAVLFDFSISIYKPKKKKSTMSHAGTELYMPPERVVSYQWDIFSLGVLIHLLTYRRMPQWDNGLRKLKDASSSLDYPKKPEHRIYLRGLILTSLSFDPEERYQSAQKMKEAFRFNSLLEIKKGIKRAKGLIQTARAHLSKKEDTPQEEVRQTSIQPHEYAEIENGLKDLCSNNGRTILAISFSIIVILLLVFREPDLSPEQANDAIQKANITYAVNLKQREHEIEKFKGATDNEEIANLMLEEIKSTQDHLKKQDGIALQVSSIELRMSKNDIKSYKISLIQKEGSWGSDNILDTANYDLRWSKESNSYISDHNDSSVFEEINSKHGFSIEVTGRTGLFGGPNHSTEIKIGRVHDLQPNSDGVTTVKIDEKKAQLRINAHYILPSE